jgi:hypothetical protein
MPTEVTREDFTALEREVEGEKMVTRHILEQTRRNGDDLAAIKSRLDRVDHRLEGVERKVDGLGHKVEGLNKNLAGIVRDVVREVLDERDRKRRGPRSSPRKRGPSILRKMHLLDRCASILRSDWIPAEARRA